METRANYLLVGSFVLAAVLGLFLFVVWLARFQFDTLYDQYQLSFSGHVTGISQGSPVHFQGVPVGQVLQIGFSKARPGSVMITIEIDASTPVKTDSLASIERSGLAGGRYILLRRGSQAATKPSQVKGVLPSLPTQSSSLDRVFESAPDVVDNINLLLDQASEMFSDRNIESVNNILTNLDTLTTSFASQRGEIDKILRQVLATMDDVRVATGQFTQTSENLDQGLEQLLEEVRNTTVTLRQAIAGFGSVADDNGPRITAALDDFSNAAASIKRLSEETEELVRDSREPLSEFAQTGLYELTLTLREFRGLVASLNRVSRELERDPSLFLFGDRQAGFRSEDQ
ncbi:MAG: MlaD family protein [Pseudomonadota bacterium]|nr:MlaD family protein [Pseudomonadota bacterium]